ncbi:unnamed protein product [Rhizophagus irregularis]|nr:unnamed protein product [Rhizophagus irregularis]
MENIFYSKVFVAGSFKFVVDEASKRDTKLSTLDKFVCNLATILARDKEVVAVNLKILPNKCKIYIAKNDVWLAKDYEYINNVKKVLINVSKEAPMSFEEAYEKDDVKKLAINIFKYCKYKLIIRLNKLRKDIASNEDEIYIKSFLDYAKSDGVDVMFSEIHVISRVCYNYYLTAKKDPTIPEKFLRHIKKVGSYIGSFIDITNCARKQKYKTLYSCIELKLLDPNMVVKTVSSWSDTVEHYFRDQKIYDEFKKKCLNDPVIKKNLVRVYGKDTPDMLDCEVTKKMHLHAELNVLVNLMDQGKKDIDYIAVSKKCCYLCDLYIKFLISKGYKITISGSGLHKKLYHIWKLPDAFKQIIEKEISNHTNIIAIPDNDPDSSDPESVLYYGSIVSYIDDLVYNYNYN